MIISFSGLGGSGKTTQIQLLRESLTEGGLESRVITLRPLFLWSRISRKLKKDSSHLEKGVNQEKRPNPIRTLWCALRMFVYWLDMWRLYLFVILQKGEGVDVVICDRYFRDFFVELLIEERGLLSLSKILLTLLPKPDLAVYLDISAEEAQRRKIEHNIYYVRRQEQLYNLFFKRGGDSGSVVINANSSVEDIQHVLYYLARCTHFSGRPCGVASAGLFDALVNGDSWIFGGAVQVNTAELLKVADMNRVLYPAVKQMVRLEAPSEAEETVKKIITEAERLKDLQQKGERLVEEYLPEGIVIKGVSYVDLVGTDVDVVVPKDFSKKKVSSSIRGEGIIVEEDKQKMSVHRQDTAPIDLHWNVSYSGFNFLAYGDLAANRRVGEALVVLSHAFEELTLLTISDVYRISALKLTSNEWREAARIAKRRGWGSIFILMQSLIERVQIGKEELPLPIPISKIVKAKFALYTSMRGNWLADSVMTLRALHARSLGKIPFHESWFTFPSPKDLDATPSTAYDE